MDSKIEQLLSRAGSFAAAFDQGNRTTVSYIDEAIKLVRQALELGGPHHRMRSVSLTSLAIHLSTRYGQFGNMQDLEEAIALDREALSLRPQGHSDRCTSLNNLATRLSTRYNQLWALHDLEEAIVLDRGALSLRPQGHPDRSVSLSSLAHHLSARYNKLGDLQDLEDAMVFDREALSLRPEGHPGHSTSLNNLAVNLSARYKRLGVLQDLEEAIVLDREALSLRLQGHPNRSMSLNSLAASLSTRYDHLGALLDLEEAIVLNREALSFHPEGQPNRSMSLNNLAVNLSTRYKRLGALRDLQEAIVFSREALSLFPEEHPYRFVSLNNLAIRLSTRYKQLGALRDLEEAIVLDREALSLCPQGHLGRSTALNNLAVTLSTRFKQLGALLDLEEAIVLDREALSLCPQGHPNRSMSLSNLAFRLSARYDQLGALQVLEEAIVLDRDALSLRPQGHPNRSTSLNNLAIHLSARYKQLGALQDLEEVISLDREVLSLRPQGHPGHSESLKNLAIALSTHYHQLVSSQSLPQADPSTANDVQEIFALYGQLADISHAVSAVDLDASRAWIQAAENFNHTSVLLAYETSLRLLVEHLSLVPTLPQHLDILKKRSSSLAVDAFSACLRRSALQRAVELLEQGRGVFWNQLTRLRSPLDAVVASGPAGKTLAEEFTRLSLLVRSALNSPGINQHEQLCQHNLEMQRVVTAIRNLPGCSRFLLPSLFSDLQRAASAGPVIVVNASDYGCDALIIFGDRDPVHVPLSITKQYVQHLSSTLRTTTARAAAMNATTLGRMLRELWDDVVSPIAQVLETTYPLQSRIWWCPTAEFSTLPLHAAGPYRKGQPNLASLYVSSYTPTLSALIHARRPHSSTSSRTVKRFVGIGQANATGQSELFSVSSELANIAQYVDGAATFTRIEDKESCISRVAEELGKNEWVHFACHGLPNRRAPFASAFALSDGDFTIERIIRCDLEDAEFAYLSACHTTVGDAESPDEAIHLASAMQFAGFRSVIGTMWAVDDDETDAITAGFYRRAMVGGRLEYERAAWALDGAIKEARVSLDQRVVYVHIGA